MEMDGQTYLEIVRHARAQIERGTAEDLAAAEAELASLHRIFPKRLEYICAKVALMIALGEDGAKCRAILDYTAQEYHPVPTTADVFELKSRTFPEKSPEWRQTRFAHDFYANGVLPQDAFARLAALKEKFLTGLSDADLLRMLAEEYYVMRNMTAYFILMMAYCRVTGREDYDELLHEDTGIPYPEPGYCGGLGFLLRMFTDGQCNAFLIVGTGADAGDMETLARALELLGQQPILLTENDAVAEGTVDVYALRCIQEAQATGGCIRLNAGKCRRTDGDVESAVPAVIRLLTRSTAQGALLIVLARDDRMSELHAQTALGREIQRLSYCVPPQFSYAYAYAWAGDYLTYANYFYGEAIEPLLDAPASCDFSIVIPVRNAADTLRYTVETCLGLDYDGSYEIVISDNSDAGRDEVYSFVVELNDPRVRYYRTPFALSIDKSFEYAYLHARGAFIFSLGADDGVLPWALKYIRQAMEDYPSADILSWGKEFYTWPGFMPEGQDLHIVKCVDSEESGRYAAFSLREDQADIMAKIKTCLYRLPLFYVNAGFRRGYLREILHRTGRIIEGISQDIYMGAINLFLQEECIEIQRPLAITGMSGHSLGATARNLVSDVEAISPVSPPPLCSRQGAYIQRHAEMAIPYITTADSFIFYTSAVRAGELGIPTNFHPVQSYTDLSNHILLADLRFERYWGLLLHGSTLCGDSVYDQCRRFYERLCNCPEEILDSRIAPPYIRKGYAHAENELRLNPAAFGCRNVADAARFEAKILNL